MRNERSTVSSSLGFESSEVFILFLLWENIKNGFQFIYLSISRSNLIIFQRIFFDYHFPPVASPKPLLLVVSRSFSSPVRRLFTKLTPLGRIV